MTHGVGTTVSVYSGDKTLLVGHRLTSVQINRPQPDTPGRSKCVPCACVGWYPGPCCKARSQSTSPYDGLDRQQEEPLCFTLFPREMSAAYTWCFCYALCWEFYGRKTRKGRQSHRALRIFRTWLREQQQAERLRDMTQQQRVRKGSLPVPPLHMGGWSWAGGLECRTKQPGGACTTRYWRAKGFRHGHSVGTPCFGATPSVQCMKRKDWRGTRREGKEAESM